MRIGVDSGGTFTDFVVLHDDGRLESFKLRSDPAAPAQVILGGVARSTSGETAGGDAEVVHGSTVATNALLERKGARTAFVTTAGFEDLLAIGRQNRPELYNLTPALPRPLVPAELCFGVKERMLFDGTIEIPLDEAELARLRADVEQAGAEAIAICLLHSYRNDAHERAVLEELRFAGYVCASCDISPEFREYERASTTVINAYVGPIMDRYLGEIERMSPHPIAIMQSNGGLLTAAEARLQPVRTILSGPAGGIVGAMEIARLAGFDRALTFDMGGTSTDVALASGEMRLTTEARIDLGTGGMPVRVPMLDIHTVGAGGGSIARVDAGSSLLVGPESAGASPGPACYGVGLEATVTDAHVVLGRIAPDQLAGGEMRIDPERAKEAVERVGAKLGLSAWHAAAAIIRVANSNMERAIRVVSVERGEDPRAYPLIAFGGCGGLHACEIAEELGIRTVIAPRMAGALSALGMVLANRMRDYSAGALAVADIERLFRRLEEQARRDLPGADIRSFADLRYAGQSYELTIPWRQEKTAEGFHELHEKIYGFSDPWRPTQVVTARVRAEAALPRPDLRTSKTAPAAPSYRGVWFGNSWRHVFAAPREAISGELRGPALITDYGSTTLVQPGWTAALDRYGNLFLTI
jgi:N-methylhydantoinase A/oxoprolinase/acetone carboxylase beta subunit